MMKQLAITPTNKVITGALAGAFTTVVMWAIATFTSVIVPAEVATASLTIFAFLVSHFVPDATETSITVDKPIETAPVVKKTRKKKNEVI